MLDAHTTEFIGLTGAGLYLLSYLLLQLRIVTGDGAAYCLMNLAAASFVMISLIHAFNSAALVIQGSFILISIYGLFRIVFGTGRL